MAGIPTAVLFVAAPYSALPTFSLQPRCTAALHGAFERVTIFGRTTALIPLLFCFLDYFCLFMFHVNSRFSSSSSGGKAVYSATHSDTPSLPLLQNCSRNSFIKLSHHHTPSSTSQQHFAQLTPSCRCASMFFLPHQLFTSTGSLSGWHSAAADSLL